VADWQHVTVGDPFRLHPDVALHVVVVEPDHALVVRGGVPMGDTAPPYDFTWAFVLNELADGNTRLVIRERYAFTRWWASLIVEPVLAVSFVMTQKMLKGIRARAERTRLGRGSSSRRKRRADSAAYEYRIGIRACRSGPGPSMNGPSALVGLCGRGRHFRERTQPGAFATEEMP
jgi:hypothetical protein